MHRPSVQLIKSRYNIGLFQAKLIKEAKTKEKKGGTAKMEKTSEAWKTQSEGFRAVVKALKQEDIQVG